MGGIAVVQDALIAGFEGPELGFREMLSGRSGLSDRLLDVEQAIDHRIGPSLLVLFVHEDQFAQMMRVAQAVGTA